jgi:hypothetical protein
VTHLRATPEPRPVPPQDDRHHLAPIPGSAPRPFIGKRETVLETMAGAELRRMIFVDFLGPFGFARPRMSTIPDARPIGRTAATRGLLGSRQPIVNPFSLTNAFEGPCDRGNPCARLGRRVEWAGADRGGVAGGAFGDLAIAALESLTD